MFLKRITLKNLSGTYSLDERTSHYEHSRADVIMLYFCPTCGNILLVESSVHNRFACRTCPYICNVTKKISSRIYPKLKVSLTRTPSSNSANSHLCFQEVDHVIGGSAAWENVDSTDAVCPACNHSKAYFMQIQIRSADEPMTTFYKCCNQNCGHNWRD